MNGSPQDGTSQPLEGTTQNEESTGSVVPRPSLLRRLLASRGARRTPRRYQEPDQRLAWRVQDILVGCGLTQADFSIAGGRIFHIPEVVSVIAGPPVGLDIRVLPGQTPDDFAAQASAIAYNLDVAEVRVVPLGPSMIRLELLPDQARLRRDEQPSG